jgi:hypothetical protein
MFKKWAFIDKYWLFCVSADTKTWAAALFVRSSAKKPAISPQLGRGKPPNKAGRGKLLTIIIIPNSGLMFNENRTFFRKKIATKIQRQKEILDADFADFAEEYSHRDHRERRGF